MNVRPCHSKSEIGAQLLSPSLRHEVGDRRTVAVSLLSSPSRSWSAAGKELPLVLRLCRIKQDREERLDDPFLAMLPRCEFVVDDT